MSEIVWIILAGAVMTYLTRIGGHLVLSRFEHIHPRVEAGLTVPAAVPTTLVAPEAMPAVRSSSSRLRSPARGGAAGCWRQFLAGAVVLIALRRSVVGVGRCYARVNGGAGPPSCFETSASSGPEHEATGP